MSPSAIFEELQGLPIRMQGAPIWTRVFDALGAAPTVIAYNEVYNAIQTGVIKAAENEAAGIEQMKFFEVGPQLAMTQHAITVRPLAFSDTTFERLDPALQDCIIQAGARAAATARHREFRGRAETRGNGGGGLLTRHPFADRAKLLELAEPVIQAYAEELGALEVYQGIAAIRDRWRLRGATASRSLHPACAMRRIIQGYYRLLQFLLTLLMMAIVCRWRCRSSPATPGSFPATSGPRRWPASASCGSS